MASIATCKLRPVELAQRPFDDAVALLIGIDQQGVVDDIGGDPDTWQHALPAPPVPRPPELPAIRLGRFRVPARRWSTR